MAQVQVKGSLGIGLWAGLSRVLWACSLQAGGGELDLQPNLRLQAAILHPLGILVGDGNGHGATCGEPGPLYYTCTPTQGLPKYTVVIASPVNQVTGMKYHPDPPRPLCRILGHIPGLHETMLEDSQ